MEYSFNLNAVDTTTLIVVATTIILFSIKLRRRRIASTPEPPIPPGSSGLPLVGNLPFLEPNLHTFFTRLAATYGPIFRLRLGSKLAIVISSAPLFREVFHDKDLVFANHDIPAAGRAITYGGLDIVWSPYGPTWRMLRRVFVRELLSPASLAAVSHLRRHQLRSAIRHIAKYAAAGDPIDIGDHIFVVVLNVVTSTLWGGTMAEAENDGGDYLKVGKRFRELVGEVTVLLGKPNLSDFFPGLERYDFQGIVRKIGVLRERLDEIYDKIIESKRKGLGVEAEKAGEDFLDYMLKLVDDESETNTPFTITHAKALLMV